MVGLILDFWVTVFVHVWSWFRQLMTAAGIVDLYLVMFAIFVVYRFLIVPIVGQSFAGSDEAERKQRKE